MVPLLRGNDGTTQANITCGQVDETFDRTKDCCFMRQHNCAFHNQQNVYNMCKMSWMDLSELMFNIVKDELDGTRDGRDVQSDTKDWSYNVQQRHTRDYTDHQIDSKDRKDKSRDVGTSRRDAQGNNRNSVHDAGKDRRDQRIRILNMVWDVGIRNCQQQWSSANIIIGDQSVLLEVTLLNQGGIPSPPSYSEEMQIEMINNIHCAFTKAVSEDISINDKIMKAVTSVFAPSSTGVIGESVSQDLPKVMVLLKFKANETSSLTTIDAMIDQIFTTIINNNMTVVSNTPTTASSSSSSSSFIQMKKISRCQNIACTLKSNTVRIPDVRNVTSFKKCSWTDESDSHRIAGSTSSGCSLNMMVDLLVWCFGFVVLLIDIL